MQRHFYACVKDVPFDVAIFDDKELRDRWVNYEDKFSKAFPDDDPVPRLALTTREAFAIVGNKLYKKHLHHPDSLLDGMSWVFMFDKPTGGILI